jgi:hypothetical protein
MPPLLRHTTPEPGSHSAGALNSRAGAPPPTRESSHGILLPLARLPGCLTRGLVHLTAKAAPAQLAPVIDLTAEDEDEELRKALTLSLGSTSNGDKPPVFGPSERLDPGQNWAMVPVSQAPTQSDNKNDNDADLRRAMEASMNMSYQDNPMPMRMKLRGDECWT